MRVIINLFNHYFREIYGGCLLFAFPGESSGFLYLFVLYFQICFSKADHRMLLCCSLDLIRYNYFFIIKIF